MSAPRSVRNRVNQKASVIMHALCGLSLSTRLWSDAKATALGSSHEFLGTQVQQLHFLNVQSA